MLRKVSSGMRPFYKRLLALWKFSKGKDTKMHPVLGTVNFFRIQFQHNLSNEKKKRSSDLRAFQSSISSSFSGRALKSEVSNLNVEHLLAMQYMPIKKWKQLAQ